MACDACAWGPCCTTLLPAALLRGQACSAQGRAPSSRHQRGAAFLPVHLTLFLPGGLVHSSVTECSRPTRRSTSCWLRSGRSVGRRRRRTTSSSTRWVTVMTVRPVLRTLGEQSFQTACMLHTNPPECAALHSNTGAQAGAGGQGRGRGAQGRACQEEACGACGGRRQEAQQEGSR